MCWSAPCMAAATISVSLWTKASAKCPECDIFFFFVYLFSVECSWDKPINKQPTERHIILSCLWTPDSPTARDSRTWSHTAVRNCSQAVNVSRHIRQINTGAACRHGEEEGIQTRGSESTVTHTLTFPLHEASVWRMTDLKGGWICLKEGREKVSRGALFLSSTGASVIWTFGKHHSTILKVCSGPNFKAPRTPFPQGDVYPP